MQTECPECGEMYDSRGIQGHRAWAHGVTNGQGEPDPDHDTNETQAEIPTLNGDDQSSGDNQTDEPNCPECGGDDIVEGKKAAQALAREGHPDGTVRIVSESDYWCNNCLDAFDTDE